jgi:hypothetical protein
VLRRSLTTGLLASTALAGCSGTTNTTVNTALSYAQAAAAGALALLPDLASLNVPAAVTNAVQTAANSLSAAASALGNSLSTTANSTTYQQIAAAVLAIAAAVSPIAGLPSIVVTAIQALQAVVPGIATALGIAGVSAARPAMSPVRAAAFLQAYGSTSGK